MPPAATNRRTPETNVVAEMQSGIGTCFPTKPMRAISTNSKAMPQVIMARVNLRPFATKSG